MVVLRFLGEDSLCKLRYTNIEFPPLENKRHIQSLRVHEDHHDDHHECSVSAQSKVLAAHGGGPPGPSKLWINSLVLPSQILVIPDLSPSQNLPAGLDVAHTPEDCPRCA